MPLTPGQKATAATLFKLGALGTCVVGPAGLALAMGSTGLVKDLVGLAQPSIDEFIRALGSNANGVAVNLLSEQLIKCLDGRSSLDLMPRATLSEAVLRDSLAFLATEEWAKPFVKEWFEPWRQVLTPRGALQQESVTDLIRNVDFVADEDLAWNYTSALLVRLERIHHDSLRLVPSVFDGREESLPAPLADKLRQHLPAVMEAQFYRLQTLPEHQAAKVQLDAQRWRWLETTLGKLFEKVQPVPAPPAPATLPRPPRCFGRDEEIARIQQTLTGGKRAIAITGAAGLGKSTLGLTALHADGVAQRFGPRRYYLRCDGLRTWEAVTLGLAEALGLSPQAPLWNRVLAHLGEAPAVLMLDNFETPYQGDGLASASVGLQQLLGVASLSAMVAMQGLPPSEVAWDLRLNATQLDAPETERLFCAIAGEHFAADPKLKGLLAALGGVARAIELLAHRAQGEPDLGFIEKLWHEKHTRLLKRGTGQSKDHSLHATYEVAITHADFTGHCRAVLWLLAAPPTGIDRADLAVLGEVAPEQALTLRNLSLIYLEGDRYRLLAPFRHYVVDEIPLSPASLRPLLRHYVEFARIHGATVGRDGGAKALRQVLRELPNLEWAIREWVSSDESLAAIEEGARAARALGEFTRFSGMGDAELLRWLAQLARDRGLILASAGCEESLGDVLMARSDHAGARASYEKALALYGEVGDKLGEANCEFSLGDILRVRSDQAWAHAKFEKALSLYGEVGAKLGEANCEFRLGSILLDRSEHSEAQAKFEKALMLYVEVGDKLGEANCKFRLGNILLDRSEHAEAQAKYEKALPLYVGVGDKLGEANCEFRLGAILLARSEPEGAQAKYEKALLLYVEVGDKLGEANCQQGLADILRARSDHVEAQAKYKKALRLYGELGWKLGEGTCQQGLGDIQRANCQDSGAKAQWELALRLFTDFGDPYSMGDAHWRLARVSDHPAETRTPPAGGPRLLHPNQPPRSRGNAPARVPRLKNHRPDTVQKDAALRVELQGFGKDAGFGVAA